jgi:hypothetical protein
MAKRLIFLILIVCSCKQASLITIEGSINNSLEEVSAAESVINSNLIWVIEDAGNDNHLYGLNKKGKIIRDITILNAENRDWEDLTSDKEGNIYIGDFGNNNKKLKTYRILKINNEDLIKSKTNADIIEFTLPKQMKAEDFEAFFILKDWCYVFSKESERTKVIMLPNKKGKHVAILRSDYDFKSKGNKITSADINSKKNIVVLLNHDKLWRLSGFDGDDFFSGNIKVLPFAHNTQKEGICFINDSIVYITDERDGAEGGNIYSFNIN